MNKRRVPKPVIATLVFLVILILGFLIVRPTLFRTFRTPPIVETIRNAREIKYALDTFAMDNDGVYPSAELADFYECPADGSSNALFRQLFASGITNNERIFWIKNAEICSKARPDDVTTINGEFAESETLQPGDNGWSYFEGLNNIEKPTHAIIVGPVLPDRSGYQRDLYHSKGVVVRIDSSIRPERVTPDGRIPDHDGRDILSGIPPGPDGKPVLRHPSPGPR